MGEPDQSSAPSIDAVDWLPSGARSGLVRVRGRWAGQAPGTLPTLLIEAAGREHPHTSLPDPRAGDGVEWRGAYVVSSDVVSAPGAEFWLLFEDGTRMTLPALSGAPAAAAAPAPEPEVVAAEGGEVVDRAVMAERRARRAEAAEQAQARIAREAMKAVEVLERKLDEISDERDELEQRLGSAGGAAEAGDEGTSDATAAIDAARAEAEALHKRLADADAREILLRAEVDAAREREAEARRLLEAAEAAPPIPEAAPPALAPAPSRDRSADRLRSALSSTIVQMAGLREQLREARLHLRTSEVARTADAVKLVVLEREHAQAREELRTHKSAGPELARLRDEVEALRERTAADAAALEALRSQAKAGEEALAAARSRLATATAAEARLAPIAARAETAEAEVARLAAELAKAEAAQTSLRRREEAAAAALDAVQAEWSRREEELQAELDEAVSAREIASAQAAAADAARRAAEVARASLAEELAAARAAMAGETAAARRAATPADPAALSRAAAELARPPAEPPAADRERLLADLSSAADTLRSRTPAFLPPSPPAPPEAAPAPIGGAPDTETGLRRPEADAGRARSPASPEDTAPDRPRGLDVPTPPAPPRGVATGRSARDYPPLRGAVVKLAHDDPDAAGRLIAGLLPAQWRVLTEPVDYDLTIAGVGTYAITVTPGRATATPIDAPRKEAEFRLQADPVSLAELIAGHGPKPRRFGRVRFSGSKRRLKALEPLQAADLSLEDALRAGATIDALLALRCLAYAIPPSWTKGHDFTIAHTIIGDTGTSDTLFLTALDGRGLAVSTNAPEPPRGTVTMTATAFTNLMAGLAPPPGERPSTRGDHRAVEQLRAWADRARASDR